MYVGRFIQTMFPNESPTNNSSGRIMNINYSYTYVENNDCVLRICRVLRNTLLIIFNNQLCINKSNLSIFVLIAFAMIYFQKEKEKNNNNNNNKNKSKQNS